MVKEISNQMSDEGSSKKVQVMVDQDWKGSFSDPAQHAQGREAADSDPRK